MLSAAGEPGAKRELSPRAWSGFSPRPRRSWARLATDYDVVGVVADGKALIEACRATRPDVIVSDIATPGVSGLDAADALLTLEPDCRIVFVTVIADREVIRRAQGSGALGYVLKGDAGEELLSAVEAALSGSPFLSLGAQLVMDEATSTGGRVTLHAGKCMLSLYSARQNAEDNSTTARRGEPTMSVAPVPDVAYRTLVTFCTAALSRSRCPRNG